MFNRNLINNQSASAVCVCVCVCVCVFVRTNWLSWSSRIELKYNHNLLWATSESLTVDCLFELINNRLESMAGCFTSISITFDLASNQNQSEAALGDLRPLYFLFQFKNDLSTNQSVSAVGHCAEKFGFMFNPSFRDPQGNFRWLLITI